MQTRHLGPTLQAALDHISQPNVLVMMNEFHDASLCLMAYTSYRWAKYGSGCKCGKEVAMHANVLAEKDERISGQHDPLAGIDSGEMRIMTAWLTEDFKLYAAAPDIFQHNVAEVEKAIGRQFLCL